MQRHLSFRQDPNLEQTANRWYENAMSAYAAAIQAHQQVKKLGAADPGASAAVKNAENNIKMLWAQSAGIIQLVQSAAAEPMSGEVAYQLALCKHEQAEQARAKLGTSGRNGKKLPPAEAKAVQDAWRAAASWWQTYLDEQRAAPGVPAPRPLPPYPLQAPRPPPAA